MTKKLPLQDGMYALVDDEDYEKCKYHTWYINITSGYINVASDSVGVLSRFLLEEVKEDSYVLFKNGDRLNFKRDNLIISDKFEKAGKRRGVRNSSSKYKGVFRRKTGKWTSQLTYKGKRYYLGTFENEEEAAIAYNKKAIEVHGEKAFQNLIGNENSAVITEKSWKDKQVKRYPRKEGLRGVNFNKKRNRWETHIQKNNNRYYLGSFDHENQAAKAYDKKAYELYGDEAILNFPEMIEEYKGVIK